MTFAQLIGNDPDAREEGWTPADGVEMPRLVLQRVLVMNGAGWAPQIGALARLTLFGDRVEIGPSDRPLQSKSVPLTSFHDLRIEGQSLTKGGKFFGGGFGPKGAIEGILAATVLNTLTTKTQRWVTIDLVADGGWVQLRLDDADPIRVRDDLRVLADAIVYRQDSEPSPASQTTQTDVDLVSSLERLAKLRDSGVLSGEEFQLAKEKLLGTK